MIKLSNIKGDLYGGITAGIVSLPLALAFGQQTEMGAIAGLYGAIAIAIFAAAFGGTPTQVSGPTAPMTVVSAIIIMEAIQYAGSFSEALPIIIATFVLAGAMQIGFGLFKLGSYIKYIPYPVVSGFMSGIGVIVIISQIFPFFGSAAPEGGIMGTVNSIANIPEIANFYAIAAAVLTIAIIYLFPKVTKKIPSSLFALILISIAAYFFIPEEAILKINSKGEIPTGLPSLQTGFLTAFTDTKNLLLITQYALTLAALGAIDSLLTSIVADNMTKTKHNSNQELVGQGVGNIVSGLFAGLPGAGATMRTVINIKSGGTTRASGMIAGLFLLAILLGLGQLVGHIPDAVLAGILITVGIGIIDYKGFRYIKEMPLADTLAMIAVLLLTVFVDLLVAVAFGMLFSAILFMKKISDFVEHKTYTESLRDFSREVPWLDEGDIIEKIGEKIYIKHLDGPLFFGFASRFKDMLNALPKVEIVVIRMDKVPYMDQSGLTAMEDVVMDLVAHKITVVFIGLHGQPEKMLRSVRFVPNLIPEEHCFNDFDQCLDWLDSKFENRILHSNLTTQSKDKQELMTPEQALDYLKKGNQRFIQGKTLQRDLRKQVRQTKDAQYPYAAVLSCIDSRAPIEKIFDQGIGDVFNARIAGNFVNNDILGSLEFACKLAGSKLIVVMGHTSCGAIKGACDQAQLGHLTEMLDKIKPAVDATTSKNDEERTSKNIDFVNSVAEKNVQLTIDRIKSESQILKEMYENNEIDIVGAMYDIQTGEVTFS